MNQAFSTSRTPAATAPDNRPVIRKIAGGKDWSVSEYFCRAGPGDRPFEERHAGFTIAAVVEGSFTYKTGSGRALTHPGALILGNDAACFECGHEHTAGDRCISLHYSPEYFAEIAASNGGATRPRFDAPMLPVAKRLTPLIAQIERMARHELPLRVELFATHVAETVIATVSGRAPSRVRVSALDERRIAHTLRHIEEQAEAQIALEGLAGIAGVSKYHFLRTFRRIVGMTPYQYLLTVRVRRAAARLTASPETVTSAAFHAGFGDLSTFNGRFRGVFGKSPSAYRNAAANGKPQAG